MQRLLCTIDTIEYFNHDTRRVVLKYPDGVTVPFKAGQYLEIELPTGKMCPFSIACAPAMTDRVELHVKPTPNSDDSTMIEAMLDARDPVTLDIPKGDCFIENPPANPLILLAASTGITQMKSIVEHLYMSGMDQPTYLYWGVLTDADLYLDAFWHAFTQAHPLCHYIPVVSEPDRAPDWTGRTGLVGEAALEDFEDLSDVTVVVGGSPGMVYATLDAFVARGMPESNMISDVFAYAPRPKPA